MPVPLAISKTTIPLAKRLANAYLIWLSRKRDSTVLPGTIRSPSYSRLDILLLNSNLRGYQFIRGPEENGQNVLDLAAVGTVENSPPSEPGKDSREADATE